jgi:hypothetical protein
MVAFINEKRIYESDVCNNVAFINESEFYKSNGKNDACFHK